ncbi:MAG: GIY-YIG nuclease family protein [Patescibacteria group bacterium]|nr:GIY-YIG nuclease family protein [Patescibacteria group bacterium]
MPWLYMIRNKGNKLYIGVTNNPSKRLAYHNQKKGAQFTQNNPSFEIVLLEKYENLSLARGREIQLKKWRRNKKDRLIIKYSQGWDTKI